MQSLDSLEEKISGVLSHSDGLYTLDDDPYYEDSSKSIVQKTSNHKYSKNKVRKENVSPSSLSDASEVEKDFENMLDEKFKFIYPKDLNGYYVEIYKKQNWAQPDKIVPPTDEGNLNIKIPRKSRCELLNFWFYHECQRVINLEMFVYLSEKYSDFDLEMAQLNFTVIPFMIYNKIYYDVDYNPNLENHVLKFIMNHLLA